MVSKISASFTLTDFKCLPEEITSILGIMPTKTWKIGDLISPRGRRYYEFNGWRLQSELQDSAELEEHVVSVLTKLQPSRKALIELCSQYDSEISCVIYASDRDEQVPAIHFEPSIVKKISELNAAIDVDMYLL